MRIGALGTGRVGRTICRGLLSLGHDVMIGTRDVDALMARREPDARGDEPFNVWAASNPDAAVGNFAEAAAHGEVVMNATNGADSLVALEAAGADNLEGKLLIDITNPLDFSAGFPPSLFVSNTDSLAEQIQREFPGARMVKTLNTVSAPVMIDPRSVAGGEHSMFLCGNDDAAKRQAEELLRELGWRDTIDLGDVSASRGTEMYLALWVRLMGKVGSPMFNIRVVK